MSGKSVARVVCLALITLPNLLANMNGLQIPIQEQAAIAILALVAGLVLNELDPSFRGESKPEPHG